MIWDKFAGTLLITKTEFEQLEDEVRKGAEFDDALSRMALKNDIKHMHGVQRVVISWMPNGQIREVGRMGWR